jgi:hypothetical protein
MPAAVTVPRAIAETEPPVAAGSETPDENGTGTIMITLDNGTTIFANKVVFERVEDPIGDIPIFYEIGDLSDFTSYETVLEKIEDPVQNIPILYEKGEPGESDISRETAISVALDELIGKYALKQEVLDRFNITATFYTLYEDLKAPVWNVSLYPLNTDEFPEIGCYTALIDAATGEAVQLLSAADGKG